MKREFPSVYGKVVIENHTLFIRSMYLPLSKTALVRIGMSLLIICIFFLQFTRDEPSKYVGLILWGVVLAGHLPELYDNLFRRSYATRIPLHRIVSYKTEDDHHGLQTTVTLQLKNGRYKKLLFRKLENQVEPFTEAVSEYLYPLQIV